MPLTTSQVAGLNALNKKIATGYTPTATDTTNLDFAKKQGYTYNPLPQGATKIASPTELTGLNENQLYREGASIYKLPEVLKTSNMSTSSTGISEAEPTGTSDIASMMAGLKTGNEGIKSVLESYTKPLESEANKSALDKRIASESESLYQGQTQAVKQAQADYALPENIKNLQNLNVSLAQRQAEFDNMIARNEGRMASASSIYGRDALLTRQKAVEMAGLSAVAQAYQGNIALANDTAKNGIDALYKPQEDYIANLKSQLTSVENDLTREEKKKADALNIVLSERERLIEEEKNNLTAINNLAIDSAKNGVDSTIVNQILNAKDLKTAIDIASKNGAFVSDETLADRYKKIGTDSNGNDLYIDSVTGTAKTADQLTSNQLGVQIGTIKGLPSYDTRSANPGVNRSDRNNNPGNIKISDYTKTFEGVAGVESSEAQDGGNFLIFETPESGINAIGRLLLEGKSYQGVNAETAIKKYNGNGSYGALNVGLDPNKDFQSQIQDPNKRYEVARAIAMAEGWSGGVSTEATSTEAKSWANLISEGKAKIENVPQKMRDQVATELSGMTTSAEKMNDELAKSKAESATDLISHKGLESATGTTRLGRTAALWNMGIKRDFIASVEQLVSGLSLESLVAAKARGATFGALSDTEMRILSSAASKIGSWAKRDETGKVVGYVIDEGSMKKELKTISDNLNNAIKKADPLGVGTSQEVDPLGVLNQ